MCTTSCLKAYGLHNFCNKQAAVTAAVLGARRLQHQLPRIADDCRVASKLGRDGRRKRDGAVVASPKSGRPAEKRALIVINFLRWWIKQASTRGSDAQREIAIASSGKEGSSRRRSPRENHACRSLGMSPLSDGDGPCVI